jgi:DnaJ-domain-containing protein 1
VVVGAGRPVAAALYSADADANAEVAQAACVLQENARASLVPALALPSESIELPAESLVEDLSAAAAAFSPSSLPLPIISDSDAVVPPVMAALSDATEIASWQFPAHSIASEPTNVTASPEPGCAMLWKILLLLPAVGGVFIAIDLRGHRRLRKAHVEPVYVGPSAPALRRSVPSPLAALGLDASSTADDVKRAYRLLAKDAHPDRGGDSRQFLVLQRNFEESLRLVNSAAARAAYRSRPELSQAA